MISIDVRPCMTSELPKVFSPSQINTYLQCPKKYFFQYVEKIPVEIESPWLELGSKVHSQISDYNFESNDILLRSMLRNAQRFLSSMPPKPIMETTYEDKNNPGRFYGEVLGRRFVGVFDYHWVDYQIAGDWKTGKLDLRFTDGYEVQAYILSEMYKQKYEKPIEEFYFNFLRIDKIYSPRCIKDDTDAKIQIEKALEGIESWSFNKSIGLLCDYCEYKSFCC